MIKAVNEVRRDTKPKARTGQQKMVKNKPAKKVRLPINEKALKKLKLVAVAYSHVEREWFPTEEAYIAEVEVEDRAKQVVEELQKLGITAKGYPGDQYFFTNLIVDDPDLVLNLVDTLKGRDSLQTSIPAALELANIPYTGAGMAGLVIGNDRNLVKQLLIANNIPTPPFQYIKRKGTAINPEIGLPLIVKLNEGGGSVGVDDKAVQETLEAAQQKVAEMMDNYKLPVIVERFIDGREINAVVFETDRKKYTFLGEKIFRIKQDGKHYFTSLESYNDPEAYHYKRVEEPLASKLIDLAQRAFVSLHNRDYVKFDIRVDEETGDPYFTDCNPNTAFGPGSDIPLTEVMALYNIKFEEILASLVSKHAKRIK
jgi:D-alanine-D-alanine ligase